MTVGGQKVLGVGKCPASVGELCQGWWHGSEVLASFGIDWYATAVVTDGKDERSPFYLKAYRGMEKTLSYFSIDPNEIHRLKLTIESTIPRTKGMASSTADIASTIAATAAFFDKTISQREIFDLCIQIEPTDATVFEALSFIDFVEGAVLKSFQWHPEFSVLILEPEGICDTEVFQSNRDYDLLLAQSTAFSAVVNLLEEAVKKQSLVELGAVGVHSALLSQKFLKKPDLSILIDLYERGDILGCCVAHSGTVMGVLLPKSNQAPKSILAHFERCGMMKKYKIHFKQVTYTGVYGYRRLDDGTIL